MNKIVKCNLLLMKNGLLFTKLIVLVCIVMFRNRYLQMVWKLWILLILVSNGYFLLKHLLLIKIKLDSFGKMSTSIKIELYPILKWVVVWEDFIILWLSVTINMNILRGILKIWLKYVTLSLKNLVRLCCYMGLVGKIDNI